MDIGDILHGITEKQATIIAANHTAAMVIDIATITLLIDADLVSIEQAAQRIEQIQKTVAGGDYALVSDRLQRVTDWLRFRDKSQRRGWTPQVIEGGAQGQDEGQATDLKQE